MVYGLILVISLGDYPVVCYVLNTHGSTVTNSGRSLVAQKTYNITKAAYSIKQLSTHCRHIDSETNDTWLAYVSGNNAK